MTVLKTGTGLEASRVNRCPMCDRDHYCYLIEVESLRALAGG